jgi:hypothetical protein
MLKLFNEPDSKHILFQHAMYELLGHAGGAEEQKKDLKEN